MTQLTTLVPSNSSKEFLGSATTEYAAALMTSEGRAAVEYLASRGLSKDSATSFRLGYVANPLPGHETYIGKIALPYLTRSGVVSIRFRTLPDIVDGVPQPISGPKYVHVFGDTPRIYNPSDLCRRESYVCICEGELDAISAHQAGLPAAGIAGVNGWRDYFARCFVGYEAVYILADNDDKGQGATFGEKLAAQIQNARVVLMSPGHDVNSTLVTEGADALLAKLNLSP